MNDFLIIMGELFLCFIFGCIVTGCTYFGTEIYVRHKQRSWRKKRNNHRG